MHSKKKSPSCPELKACSYKYGPCVLELGSKDSLAAMALTSIAVLRNSIFGSLEHTENTPLVYNGQILRPVPKKARFRELKINWPAKDVSRDKTSKVFWSAKTKWKGTR